MLWLTQTNVLTTILHIELYNIKEFRLRNSPPAVGRVIDIFHFRRSAICAEHSRIGNFEEISYTTKNRDLLLTATGLCF